MQHIPSVLELFPLLVREGIAPLTLALSDQLEAAELLHTVDFVLRERNLRVALAQPLNDGRQVDLSPLVPFPIPIRPAVLVSVMQVLEARLTRRERIATAIFGLGYDVQAGELLPVEAEEPSAEVACSLNDALGAGSPEGCLIAGESLIKEMLVASA